MKSYKIKRYLSNKVPNLLSLLRIIISIYLSVRFYINNKIDILFVLLFSIAAISDKLDGYYAKKLNATTNFGKLIDPIADKILTFVMIYIFYKKELFPIWAVGLCILKDISISIYRYIKLKKGIIIGSLKLGRYKTAYNLIVFGIVLLVLLNISVVDNSILKKLKLMLITTIL